MYIIYMYIHIYIGGRAAYLHRYLRIITYKRVILSYTPALLMIIKTPRSILFALEYFLKFSPDNGAPPPPPPLPSLPLPSPLGNPRVLGLPRGSRGGNKRREESVRGSNYRCYLCTIPSRIFRKEGNSLLRFGADKYSRGQLTCNNAITRIQLYRCWHNW